MLPIGKRVRVPAVPNCWKSSSTRSSIVKSVVTIRVLVSADLCIACLGCTAILLKKAISSDFCMKRERFKHLVDTCGLHYI
ncbi:hypothetical protein CC78DRAFT_531110 [Lojkania enalia]|uniref:Uncharacterized protein n=1 Tax=Lojkania enalia TaxID=147567 RepID=A0A9P4KD35_9PLEO|nr:hypothetical protein CC78DRAFT_531110 [Didymosphaeria enalia]